MQLQTLLNSKNTDTPLALTFLFRATLVFSLWCSATYCMEDPLNVKQKLPTGSNKNSGIKKELIGLIQSLKQEQNGLIGSAQFGVEREEDQEPLRSELVEELINESPHRIKKLISDINKRQNPDDLFQKAPYMSNIHVLVGSPGTGKSSLAKAIAKKCSIPYLFVAIQLLSNQYQHSGSSNLASILGPLSRSKKPEVIILDELQTIVKKRGKEDYDMEGAQSLWKFLDTFKNKKNLLIIATANDLDILPDQVRSRIKVGIHDISLPDQSKREKIISYYLHLYSPSLQAVPSPSEIQFLGYKTKKFTPRDLETMIRAALSNAHDRSGDEILVLDKKDFDAAIALVTKDDERFSISKRTYKMIKPHIGTTIQIMGPLTIQIIVNSFMQYCGMNQQVLFHNESIGLQREGLDLQKKSFAQQERFHNENKNLTLEHFRTQLICQIVGNIPGAIYHWYYGSSTQPKPQ